jgi:hypothetical protein
MSKELGCMPKAQKFSITHHIKGLLLIPCGLQAFGGAKDTRTFTIHMLRLVYIIML